jgi:hypothetical protein
LSGLKAIRAPLKVLNQVAIQLELALRQRIEFEGLDAAIWQNGIQ